MFTKLSSKYSLINACISSGVWSYCPKALGNKEKLNTAGLAARQRVLEKFSQEAWENKLIKIIE